MTDLSSETSAGGTNVGPGRLIRRAREQAGLSIEDLGAQVKLPRGTLDSLERDDFATLSEPVYVRGYYRKLSKVLAVSEAALLGAYEAQVTPKAPPPPSKLILAGENDLGGGGRVGLRLVIGVLISGLLLGVLAFWGSTRSTPAEVVPVAEPSLGLAPASSSDLGVSEPTAAVGTEPPATAVGEAPSVVGAPMPPATLTLAPSLSQISPSAPPPVVTANPSPGGRAEVQLQFNATSWTRIEDATGKSLLSGVIQAGDRQTLSGEAPLSIFLGNAPGVLIQYNGKTVDMTPYVKRNNTAQFTLP